MNYNDIQSIIIIGYKEAFKHYGFEVSDKKAVLKHNVFFNSIFAVFTVDFPTQKIKIDMIDANGDLYLPFYSNFYGVIDSVADTIQDNLKNIIDDLKGENLIWH